MARHRQLKDGNCWTVCRRGRWGIAGITGATCCCTKDIGVRSFEDDPDAGCDDDDDVDEDVRWCDRWVVVDDAAADPSDSLDGVRGISTLADIAVVCDEVADEDGSCNCGIGGVRSESTKIDENNDNFSKYACIEHSERNSGTSYK